MHTQRETLSSRVHAVPGSDDQEGHAAARSFPRPSGHHDADDSEYDEAELRSESDSPYGEQWGGHSAYHPGSVLTMEDEILLQHPYVPSVSPEMERMVGASDDERGRR
jgi:hypothetical protein